MDDVFCPKCGEPWEVYSLIEDYDPIWLTRMAHGLGCPSCFRKREQKVSDSNLDKANLLELHSWIEKYQTKIKNIKSTIR